MTARGLARRLSQIGTTWRNDFEQAAHEFEQPAPDFRFARDGAFSTAAAWLSEWRAQDVRMTLGDRQIDRVDA
eukprot:6726071-Prymnesium_polylepis.2